MFLKKNIKNLKSFLGTIMLRCILKNVQKYVIRKYFQIVFLVSKTTFMQWLQVLKSVNYVFFTNYNDSKFS